MMYSIYQSRSGDEASHDVLNLPITVWGRGKPCCTQSTNHGLGTRQAMMYSIYQSRSGDEASHVVLNLPIRPIHYSTAVVLKAVI